MKLTLLERPTPKTAKDFKTQLEKGLNELKGELTASVTLDGFSKNGWAQVAVTGEDSEILGELVANKFGRALTTHRELEVPGVYQASITNINTGGMRCDIGLGNEDLAYTISTGTLLAQLADGKEIQLRQLVECYCLYPGVKISIRTSRQDDKIEPWLSDEYMAKLSGWVTSGLDRVLVFDCYKHEVESAILDAHLTRDVLTIEPVTLTVQAIKCKLGTDAVGLIPKLGRILRRQILRPFQPRKIAKICRPW
jgi:hypothetical protein